MCLMWKAYTFAMLSCLSWYRSVCDGGDVCAMEFLVDAWTRAKAANCCSGIWTTADADVFDFPHSLTITGQHSSRSVHYYGVLPCMYMCISWEHACISRVILSYCFCPLHCWTMCSPPSLHTSTHTLALQVRTMKGIRSLQQFGRAPIYWQQN